jgi:hypothetical protein
VPILVPIGTEMEVGALEPAEVVGDVVNVYGRRRGSSGGGGRRGPMRRGRRVSSCVRWFAVAEASVASCECPLYYIFFFFFGFFLFNPSSFVYRVANWVFFQTFLMFELINSKT